MALEKWSDKSFDELVELVKRHHSPKPSVIVQQFRFNSCVHRAGEKVAAFVAELRQLTEHCEFGTSLDNMLQHMLLAESDLTLKKAFDLALGMESADSDARDMQTSKSVNTLWGKKHQDRQSGIRSAIAVEGSTELQSVGSRRRNAATVEKKPSRPFVQEQGQVAEARTVH